MEQVLAVGDLNFDPALVTDISQLSAEEFLSYVRWEAEQYPDVVRAPVDSSQFDGRQTEYMPRVVEIPECHDMFLPSLEWESEVIERFSRFRQNLSNMSKDLSTRERKETVPPMKDERSWFRFCLGGELPEGETDSDSVACRDVNGDTSKCIETVEADVELRKNILLASLLTVNQEHVIEEREKDHDGNDDDCLQETAENDGNSFLSLTSTLEEGEIIETSALTLATVPIEYSSGVYPSNQLLLQFDQVLTQRLLSYFSSWLQLPSCKVWNDISEKSDSSNNKNFEGIYQSNGKMSSWIFSLLARLEKPLYMDASATVRDIYRYMCIQRAELSENVLAQLETNSNTKRPRDSSIAVDIDVLPEETKKILAILNTVVVVCGNYFGQKELDCNQGVDDERSDGTETPNNCSDLQTDESYKLENYVDY